MSFLKDTFITSGGRGLAMILGAGFVSASSWLLGPEGRGEFATYMVFGMLLALGASCGVEMAGAYYAGTKKYKLSEVVNAEIFIIMVTTLVVVIVCSLLWWLHPAFMDKFSKTGLVLIICYVPFMLTNTSFWFLHSALGNSVTYSIGNVLWMAVRLLGILLLCWKTRSSESAVLACVIALFITTLFYYISLNKKNKIMHLKMSLYCVKDLYAYGFRYFFARLAQFLNMQIGTMVIVFLGTKQDVGFFSASMGLVAQLTVLPEIVGAVLLSRVVKHQENSLAITAKAIRSVFWLVLGASILLAIFSKPVISLVLSPKFLPALVPMLCLMPGVIIRCCSKTIGVYINGIGRPGINSIAIVCAVVTNAVMMYILLPIYGVAGAAIAATLGYVVDAIVVLSFYKFSLNHPLMILLPGPKDLVELFNVFRNLFFSRFKLSSKRIDIKE